MIAAVPRIAAAQDDGGGGDQGDQVYSKKEQRYVHKEGEYGGVTPGVIYPYDDADYKKRIKRPTNSGRRKHRVTWVGFQPKDDGSARVFLQLTSEQPYSQAVVGKTLEVWVHGGRLANRNNARRLDAAQFDTAIRMIKARRVGRSRGRKGAPAHPAGVQLTIHFKSAADVREAQASMSKEKDDYYYLFLDFGPPSGGTTGGGDSGDQPE